MNEGGGTLILAIIVVMLVFMGFIGLTMTQSSGEPPEFSCSPGGVYTFKECK